MGKQEITITKEDIKNGFIEIGGKFYRFNLKHNGLQYLLHIHESQVFENGKLKFIDSNIRNYSFMFAGEKCRVRYITLI